MDPKDPKYIKVVWGVGYKLENSDDLEKRNVANENIVRENIVKKSRNWKILGIIAMILTIFIAAGTTVGLYPYMEEKAAEFSSRNRRQETEAAGGFGNLATQVMNFSYVLWHQQKQEENGGILTYSQTFLAGDGIGAVDVLHGEDAQNVPETEKRRIRYLVQMQWSVQMWQKMWLQQKVQIIHPVRRWLRQKP